MRAVDKHCLNFFTLHSLIDTLDYFTTLLVGHSLAMHGLIGKLSQAFLLIFDVLQGFQ